MAILCLLRLRDGREHAIMSVPGTGFRERDA